MRILFCHTNFPAQFGIFGMWLAKSRGWDVTFATARADASPPQGCRMIKFKSVEKGAPETHRHARLLDRAVTTAEGFAAAAISAREKGYEPDIVVAHSGWGAGTYAKAVWPTAKFVPYLEWWYSHPRIDVHPDDTFPSDTSGLRANALTRNAPVLVDFAAADATLCPTAFQASRFPDYIRQTMQVLHDGVDAATYSPDRKAARAQLATEGVPEDVPLITYATRGMEPYRGFPEFMRAAAEVMKHKPDAHVMIAGENRVAYGEQLPEGESWKDRMLAECDMDPTRLHFVGLLPPKRYCTLLQASDCHVYLTIPFVLSWSFIEAMSVGCALVASDAAPVREAVGGDDAALLVEHYDVAALTAAITATLDDTEASAARRKAARARVLEAYDRSWIWPMRAHFLKSLVDGDPVA